MNYLNRKKFIKNYKEIDPDEISLKNHDWIDISAMVLSENFIDYFCDKLYWGLIFKFSLLSKSFIEKHTDKIVIYDDVIFNNYVSENFIRKHLEKFCWTELLYNKNVSEKFMEELIESNPNKIIHFDMLIRKRILSERFIEKNVDKFGWSDISEYFHMSDGFIKKYEKFLIKEKLKDNRYLRKKEYG